MKDRESLGVNDDLLGQLRSAGNTDSEGEFTVDTRHALDKLRSYQLAEPAQAVLKMVQSAVAAGASKILIESGQGVAVMHDGRTFSDEALSDLLLSVLNEPRDAAGRALVSLAIGVNAAMVEGGTVDVACLRDGAISRAVVSSEGVRFVRETGLGFPAGWTTRITALRLPVRGGALQRQLPLLRYAPVPIYCDDRLVNLQIFGAKKKIPFWQPAVDALVLVRPGSLWSSYYDPGHHVTELRWLAAEGQPAVALPYPGHASLGLERAWDEPLGVVQPTAHAEIHPRNQLRRIYDVMPRSRRLAVYRGAAAVLARSRPSEIEFVLDGVVVNRQTVVSPSGLHIVMAVDPIHTDLSQFSVVRDALYDAAMQLAIERGTMAWQAFLQRFSGNAAYALSSDPLAKVVGQGIGYLR